MSQLHLPSVGLGENRFPFDTCKTHTCAVTEPEVCAEARYVIHAHCMRVTCPGVKFV